MICDECETVAHCMKNGCVPKTNVQQCNHCNGSGRMVRDPDIGTDQECFVCDGSGAIKQEQPAPVQQEPVAWMQDSIELYVQDRPSEYYTIPLYTAPPAQREFVGLTDDEIEQGQKESWVSEQAWQSAVWWAVEKLKAKNSP